MVHELYTLTESQQKTSAQPPTTKQNDKTKGFLTGIFNKKKN